MLPEGEQHFGLFLLKLLSSSTIYASGRFLIGNTLRDNSGEIVSAVKIIDTVGTFGYGKLGW